MNVELEAVLLQTQMDLEADATGLAGRFIPSVVIEDRKHGGVHVLGWLYAAEGPRLDYKLVAGCRCLDELPRDLRHLPAYTTMN